MKKIPDKYHFQDYEPSTINIYNHEGNILLRAPSLLAVNTQLDVIVAVGEEARNISGQDKDVIVFTSAQRSHC